MLASKVSLIPYQQGSTVYHHTYPSEHGDVILFVTKHGICGLHFLVKSKEEHIALIQKKLHVTPVHDPYQVDPWWQRLHEKEAKITLALHGTPFQMRVWDALCTIPQGETRSYMSIAKQIGKDKGARAIARACAQNLVACLIPCHRVVCRDGKISGYRWHVEKKRALLQQEGVQF